ncbi:GerAB/ArcD/ProY family transporter [Cytobacillus firmus]|uniref:GerAB/ArcD/ProY family transporter n=1 Tax=Cytobacillus firmus TaxID=1399 RepID=UPI001F23CE0D|nr:GerAB/ArcD/ProY family transporter [Cytobacillus firmus]MEC1892883.1 GerAB/ArcD/ProY family transporter [Cytobacillus firmus]MED4450474.1 GerAB/ArcD/ProY family transporter [Cytobacillus firmus]MED4769738.1 GerAB/ArcD/ProY family transporter [Cytobacillus firmus]
MLKRTYILKGIGDGMLKENISLSQLLTLLINFLLGSAIVVGVGGDAKKDAWIAIAAAILIGFGIMLFYYFLISRVPGNNFFELMEFGFKRPLAIIFSITYVVYFLYLACRVVRDFGELIASAILPSTPIEIISLTICLLMAYILYLGLEVLGRTSEIFTPYLFGFLFLLTILLFASGNANLNEIKPVLGDGVKPVLKALFPTLIVFPFGELIAFTLILPVVTNFKYCLRVSLLGVAIAGALLLFAMFLMIVTLGADALLRSNFPMLSSAREVSIGNFIERIDALVVFIMMLGILVKGSVFMFAGLKGLEYTFRLPYRYFSLPVAMIVSAYSVLISVNFGDHWQEGLEMVPYCLHLPMQFGLPSLLLIAVLWKRRKKKAKPGTKGMKF